MSWGVVPSGDPGGYQSNYGGYAGGFWDTYNPFSYGEDDYEYQNDAIAVKGSGKQYWFKVGSNKFDYFSENGGSSSNPGKRKRDPDEDPLPPEYRPPAKRPPLQIPGGAGSAGPSEKPPMWGSPVAFPVSGDQSQLRISNSNMSGRAIHGFPGPFRSKKVNAILGEEMHESRKIYLSRLSGRIIPDVKWRSANKYKAVTMMFGDVIAENDTTVNVEEVGGPLGQGGDTSALKDNFALATTQVVWGTNRYGDICLSNCMPFADPSGSSDGVANSVINKKFLLTNIWSGVPNGQTGNQRMSLPALAALNSSEYGNNAVLTSFVSQMYPATNVNVGQTPAGLEALFKYESEVVVCNPMNYACQVEAYLMVPKYENYSESPMLFWETSDKEAAYEMHMMGENTGPNQLGAGEQYRPPIQETWKNDLSRSPTSSVAFNNRYRVVDKKTVVIGSGHTTKFVSSVPWSLIKRDIIESTPTLKGVTHFIWLRICSPQLYNNDSHALVNTNGTVLVQQFEKISVKPVEPVFIPKVYNFIKFAGENSTTIAQNQMINPDGNTVTPGAKLNMDVV